MLKPVYAAAGAPGFQPDVGKNILALSWPWSLAVSAVQWARYYINIILNLIIFETEVQLLVPFIIIQISSLNIGIETEKEAADLLQSIWNWLPVRLKIDLNIIDFFQGLAWAGL